MLTISYVEHRADSQSFMQAYRCRIEGCIYTYHLLTFQLHFNSEEQEKAAKHFKRAHWLRVDVWRYVDSHQAL